MEYLKACQMAVEYFSQHIGVTSLGVATENESEWFFSPGENHTNIIGQIIIGVSKQTGELRLVNILSDEDFDAAQNSSVVAIPQAFRS